ncbi:MAG: acyltransferase [Acidimicrobiia bacterium]|nr:acyltransferase [Acidimicrobiia bacterium]
MTALFEPTDPPALRRLAALDFEPLVRHDTPEPLPRWRPMGYQPGLDGVRALSVVAVILYHAGFPWMHGGFFGVEVFFVVSGFLITSLLLDERVTAGSVTLRQFWLRRARRLLPALLAVLAAVAVWALVFGSPDQRWQLRRDLPWALAYGGNWGQIAGDVPYYAGDPPLLRHLWSLAIEEQFYLLWPLAFVALTATVRRRTSIAKGVAAVAVGLMVLTFWLHRGFGRLDVLGGVDRVNFMYLSTFTRASGLLLGVAAAFVWQPWRTARADRPSDAAVGRRLDVAGAIAVALLGCIAATASLTAGYVYQWLLALVSLLSLVVVLVVVHPAASRIRRTFGWRPLVAVGRRSYGLYLWHWPIFVFAGATHGSVARVAGALAITAVVSELCYRYVETPIRRGALGRWWAATPSEVRLRPLAIGVSVVMTLAGAYALVGPFDRAAGGTDVEFDAPPGPTAEQSGGPSSPAPRALPRQVAIVGDSQAHSLAINAPGGLEQTLVLTDGSIDGCSIYDGGRVHSSREFDNSFSICENWRQDWARAAQSADGDLVLVVLGAWDVFDLETADGTYLTFASPEWDRYVTAQLQSGVDAVVDAGADVALLEVPCMRPQDVDGAGVPALPERGDDARVAHVNDLWRQVAAANPGTVRFVEGPDEWCGDPAVGSDLGYRWDGVHVYKPGADLIFESIAPVLAAL